MTSIFPNRSVDVALFENIMRTVRVDGPLDAPVCFLTMEDGGGFKPEEMQTREQFASWFGAARPWIPGPGELDEELKGKSVTQVIGQLGVKLSKIMARLAGAKEHGRYVRDMLYQRNEMNLKYYPISFATADGGKPEIRQRIEGYLGMTLSEYREACNMLRPALFLGGQDFKLGPERFYVICCAPWYEVLKQVFAGENMSYRNTYTHRDGAKEVFRLYFDATGRARFAYLSLFDRAVSDAHLAEFADLVRQCAPPEVTARLKAA